MQKIEVNKRQFNDLIRIIEGMHEYNVLTYQANRRRQLYKLIVREATNLMKTKIGSLMLFNSKTGKLEIVASRGLSKKVVKSTNLQPGEGIAGKVFESGKAIFCEDIEKDTRFKRRSHIKYYSKSFVAVPLKIRGDIVGVLNINNKESRSPFAVEEMKILTIIADEAAMTIENQNLLRRLEGAYIDTVQTLAKVLDERIPSTRGHSGRVADLASRLGPRLHLDRESLEMLRNAGLIHDIGKIGIPDRILLKPSSLNLREKKVIQRHPKVGSDVIGFSEFFNKFVPIIAFHHEWYNGKGYPLGIKGDRIPLGARIIAVCDAWDAMISTRPYREAMAKKEAVAEILKGSGSQFDPEIAKEFLKMVHPVRYRLPNAIVRRRRCLTSNRVKM